MSSRGAAASSSSAAAATYKPRDKVRCKWRDGTVNVAEILEERVRSGKHGRAGDDDGGGSSSSAATREYYVHYVDYNKRLDEWVTADRIVGHYSADDDVGDDGGGAAGGGRGGGGRGRGRGRGAGAGGDDGHGHDDHGHHGHGHEAMDPQLAALEKEHEEITKVKNIPRIELGRHEIDAWYYSPYPDEFSGSALPEDKLYVCEFCLRYMKRASTLLRHKDKCALRHPPGDEIYRDGALSVFEVDGKDNKMYCQNLCLLAKLFLDHKTLYYDVDPFLFYVLTEVDDRGAHIVGYFSKEKHSPEEYNLACILTFPPYQRKGYGKFLISFSYELSKLEAKVGSPEKPLSDLGKLSYRSYWTFVLLSVLKDHRNEQLSVRQISQLTSIKPEDIISTLQALRMIHAWKDQHVVRVRSHEVEAHLASFDKTRLNFARPHCIRWNPRPTAAPKGGKGGRT